jgi:hypothetical protein
MAAFGACARNGGCRHRSCQRQQPDAREHAQGRSGFMPRCDPMRPHDSRACSSRKVRERPKVDALSGSASPRIDIMVRRRRRWFQHCARCTRLTRTRSVCWWKCTIRQSAGCYTGLKGAWTALVVAR